jgi:hypothetical protein
VVDSTLQPTQTAANIVSKEKEPVAEAVPVGARPLDRRV